MNPYFSVKTKLGFEKDLPYAPDWSAAPDFITIIAEHCLQHKPKTIVECSSGLTTLVLSRCCQINGEGRVTSFENGEEYVEKTSLQLAEFGLTGLAEVIYAPLLKQTVNKDVFDWYSWERMGELSIDMLVIDGPPGFIQPYSRYPAMPLLIDQMSDDCVIFLDDSARNDEKMIVERWLRQYPTLQHEYIETERGCSILSFRK